MHQAMGQTRAANSNLAYIQEGIQGLVFLPRQVWTQTEQSMATPGHGGKSSERGQLYHLSKTQQNMSVHRQFLKAWNDDPNSKTPLALYYFQRSALEDQNPPGEFSVKKITEQCMKYQEQT